MPSLLDIKPPEPRSVDLPSGTKLDGVVGLSAKALADLLEKFPDKMQAFMKVGGNVEQKAAEMVDAQALELYATMIAYGCGYSGEDLERAKTAAMNLELNDMIAAAGGIMVDSTGENAKPPLSSASPASANGGGEAGKGLDTNSRRL